MNQDQEPQELGQMLDICTRTPGRRQGDTAKELPLTFRQTREPKWLWPAVLAAEIVYAVLKSIAIF